MYTYGMYNFAGEWAYTVSLPAKREVCGGIIVIGPNQSSDTAHMASKPENVGQVWQLVREKIQLCGIQSPPASGLLAI